MFLVDLRTGIAACFLGAFFASFAAASVCLDAFFARFFREVSFSSSRAFLTGESVKISVDLRFLPLRCFTSDVRESAF